MIWLTWRQFRAAAAMMAVALAVLAAVLALTGPGLADDYSTGIAACTQSGGCSDFVDRFFDDHQGSFLAVTAVVLVLPALIGLFWGAPLITRELEAGTHRLVWNQSITRTRWLAVKLGLIGLAAVTAAGLGSLAVTWWSSPIDKTAARLPADGAGVFAARGIVPIAYAAFAFALGRDRRDAGPPHPARHGHHPGRLRRRPGRHAAAGPAPPAPAHPFDRRDHRIEPDAIQSPSPTTASW